MLDEYLTNYLHIRRTSNICQDVILIFLMIDE